jgi:hypothetical protein
MYIAKICAIYYSLLEDSKDMPTEDRSGLLVYTFFDKSMAIGSRSAAAVE